MLNREFIIFIFALFVLVLPYIYVTENDENKQKTGWRILERISHFSGLKFIWRKFFPHGSQNRLPTGWLWVVGIYVFVFFFTSQRYENVVSRMEYNYNMFTTGLSSGEPFSNKRLLAIITRETPVKPYLLDPASVYQSLFTIKKSPGSITSRGYADNYFKSFGFNTVDEFFQEFVDQWKDKLGGADFSDARLNKLDLEETDLSRVNFSGATLNAIDFVAADLKASSFANAKISDTQFLFASMDEVTMTGADIKETHFSQASLKGASFIGARLEKNYFRITDLEHADFKGATLKEADFSKASLKHANFEDAILDKTSFQGAELEGADFSNAKLLTAKQLIQARSIYNLKGCPERVLNDIINYRCQTMVLMTPDKWSKEFRQHRMSYISMWKSEETKDQPKD